jgi:predicted RNase H-like HicB family nuclease
MKAEFTAIIEPSPDGGFWSYCPEIPGANGQGDTVAEAKDSLRLAVELILEDRRMDMMRGLPSDAIQESLLVG